ncbi:MAG: formate dehydrogenase accessory sulfurtransferase FdhD [Actinomycetales bacterium]
MGHTTSLRPTVRLAVVPSGHPVQVEMADRIAVEAPLTIAIGDQPVITTMRTPGHDLELAAGWLVGEVGLRSRDELVALRAGPAGGESGEDGTVQVSLAAGIQPPRPRATMAFSACGICSADLVEGFPAPYAPLHSPGWQLQPGQALDLVERMRSGQRMFDLTGALHGAALVTPDLQVRWVREDVGRHNAVDKVIGAALLDDALPLTDHVLVVSGRVAYEIVAKALRACIGAIVAVSGPTTMAVDVARAHDLLLIGFARQDRMNVYAGQGWLAR